MKYVQIEDNKYNTSSITFSPMDVDHENKAESAYAIHLPRSEFVNLLGEEYTSEHPQIIEVAEDAERYNTFSELLENKSVSSEVVLDYFGATYVLGQILGKSDKTNPKFTVSSLDEMETSELEVILKGTGGKL